MEHLWAPWRKTYVTKNAETGANLFWEIGQSTDDEANFVLQRGKSCYAVLNVYPYNAGHLMVIPYRKVKDLDDLGDEELLELMTMVKKMKTALTSISAPHGFNIGINLGSAAGAGIAEHLHVHLVPRWDHDANFMTTTGGTRVHPSDLKEMYRDILKELKPMG